MRGRKAKPTKQKLLAGNPGKRALNKNEPEYLALTSADAPDWFPQKAIDAWNFYAPQLISSKVLTSIDLHNLSAFCMAYSRWRDAEEALMREGLVVMGAMGGPIKNPAATIINEALKQMATFGGALGLDPASRSRIKTPPPQNENPFKNI